MHKLVPQGPAPAISVPSGTRMLESRIRSQCSTYIVAVCCQSSRAALDSKIPDASGGATDLSRYILVSGLLWVGLKSVQAHETRVWEMLLTEELAAITTEAKDNSTAIYRQAASQVVGHLRSAVALGMEAHLLLPIYCPSPPHVVAGVLDMSSGRLDVYDSFGEEVSFACAPADGGVPAYVAAQVQKLADWFDNANHKLHIVYNFEANYHCLGQQDDGWRCGLFTVYNLLDFARRKPRSSPQQTVMYILTYAIDLLCRRAGLPPTTVVHQQ